jgi:PAS domain-containing protein
MQSTEFGYLGTIISNKNEIVFISDSLKNFLKKLNGRYFYNLESIGFTQIMKFIEGDESLSFYKDPIRVNNNLLDCTHIFNPVIQQELIKQVDLSISEMNVYRDMFNSITEGIFMCDEQGIAVYANDYFIKVSGAKRGISSARTYLILWGRMSCHLVAARRF